MQHTDADRETYNEKVDIQNTLKMRELYRELPSFCRQFFRGIAETTESRTRLAYAYDLRVFFEYMHENNPILAKMEIHDFPLSVLDRIEKEENSNVNKICCVQLSVL